MALELLEDCASRNVRIPLAFAYLLSVRCHERGIEHSILPSDPNVWIERTCLYQFHEDPRTVPANASDVDVNYLARRSSELLIEALENDLFPSKNVETVFGICMEHPLPRTRKLGQLVRDAWDRLYRYKLVSVESITSAQLRGTLPYFFEQKVFELE